MFFVSALEREEPNAKGELVERRVPFWKSFTVFNIAQVDGLPARLPGAPKPEIDRLATVDAYLAARWRDPRRTPAKRNRVPASILRHAR